MDEKEHKDAAHQELKRKIQSGLASGVSSRTINDIFEEALKKLLDKSPKEAFAITEEDEEWINAAPVGEEV